MIKSVIVALASLLVAGCSGQKPVVIPTELGQYYVRHQHGEVEFVVNRSDGTTIRERATEQETEIGKMSVYTERCGTMVLFSGAMVNGPWICENCSERPRMPEGCPIAGSEARGMWRHVGP